MVQVVENAAAIEAEIVEWNPTSSIPGHGLLVTRPTRVEAVPDLPNLLPADQMGKLLEVHVRYGEGLADPPQPGTIRRLRVRLARPNRYFAVFTDAK